MCDEKVVCSVCGQELEIGDYPFCSKSGGHESIYSQNANHFDPIVIHKDAAGNIRFPGSKDAPVPAGFQKVELTTVNEVRRFEREVNQFEDTKASGLRHMQRANSERERKERREEFKQVVQNKFSLRGRRFAEAMMQARDQRKGRLDRPAEASNFHVDVFSQDSSNREAHYDQRTGWRGRKG